MFLEGVVLTSVTIMRVEEEKKPQDKDGLETPSE